MTSSTITRQAEPLTNSNATPHHIGAEMGRAPSLEPELERSGSDSLFNCRQQRTNFGIKERKIFDEIIEEGLRLYNLGNRENDKEKRDYGNKYMKKAIRWFLCGDWVQPGSITNPSYICVGCGHLEPIVQHCNLRICPECSIKKANQYKKLYLPILEKYHRPGKPHRLRFMTLTVKNQMSFGKDDHENLRKALRRFRRYVKVLRYVWKAIASFEITYHAVGEARYDKVTGEFLGYYTENNAGWHPHIHIIYYGRYFPNTPKDGRLLTQEWQKACKGLFETEITDVRDLKKGDFGIQKALNELIQYVGKGSTLADPGRAVEYMNMMEGKRLVSTWGFQEKIGRLPKMVCPVCGCDDWYFHKGLSKEEIRRRQMEEMQTLPYYLRKSEVG